MEIINNLDKRNTTFCQLKNGDVFMYENRLYLKIPDFSVFNKNSDTEDEYNAISLTTWQYTSLWGSTRVLLPSKTQLIVE